MNPLQQLHHFGQSFWYDAISRKFIASGELARMVASDGLRGMTSNPTIFQKAISDSSDYDPEIAELVARDYSLPEICEELMIEDIRDAADAFLSLYEESGKTDGFVSLEVSPTLAYETEDTVKEAERLFAEVDRPNVMIKIPATAECIPAIERTIAKGINVNVTMLFSRERYEQVVSAYLNGLERASSQGIPLTGIASVASLFVSRVDTLVDRVLGEISADPALQGKTGIANARLLYHRFKEIFHGARFAPLKSKGAQVQRLLWASTSTKNPKYSDVMYCEALIGPETVDTMPAVSVKAFRDHGKVAATLEQGVDEAEQHMERLREAGINYSSSMQRLEDDGIAQFTRSSEMLEGIVSEKREELLARGLKE